MLVKNITQKGEKTFHKKQDKMSKIKKKGG